MEIISRRCDATPLSSLLDDDPGLVVPSTPASSSGTLLSFLGVAHPDLGPLPNDLPDPP